MKKRFPITGSYRKTLLGGLMVVSLIGMGVPYAVADTPAESVSSATVKVSGRIIDSTGEPLIGATVLVKGSATGAAADIDGNFQLTAPKGATLVVSYVGYKAQQVKVSPNPMTITLVEDNSVLDEVVVVGYGSQKKETLTGAVTVVGEKAMANKGNLSSPVQALQGQVPGVIITRGSAAPGDESWSMSLRGSVSKNAAPPLVIIDGIEYESVNELRLINPSDIESINFLKDAAASIYGSKAAGGVVLVTTKKAKDTKLKVDYAGSVTAKHPGLKANLMTLDEWSDAVIQARTNDGYGDDDVWMRYAKLAQAYKNHYIDLDHSANPYGSSAFIDVADFVFFDNNWNDIMWGDAVSTSHELSISGGRQGATFRLSAGFMFDDSNLRWGKNNNKRYNLRLSNTFDLTDKLHLTSVIAYNRQEQVAPSQIGAALSSSTAQPGMPSSTIDGKPYAWGTWATPNWICERGGDNKLSVNAINISESFVYNILPGFNANVTLGYNTSQATRDTKENQVEYYNYAGTRQVLVSPQQSKTSYTKTNSRTNFYSVQGFLDWNHAFGDHDVKLMAGVQYNFKDYDYSSTKALDIQPELDVINGSGTVSIPKVESWEESILSYFGRANYNYLNRYLFEFQARYDGSSKFQAKNRWAFFWGASAGWRISEEKFMEGTRSWLSDLKLRASYGNVGNQSGIDRYSGILLYGFHQGTGAIVGGNNLSYLDTNGKLASTDRTWERVHNYNVGLDFGFLNNRLTGSFEAFWKRTNNMLIDVTYPGILGAHAPTTYAPAIMFDRYQAPGGSVPVSTIGDVPTVRGRLKSARNEAARAIIGISQKFESGRKLSADIQVQKVAGTSTGSNPVLTALLVEDGIVGFQAPNYDTYEHNEAVRLFLTAPLGDRITFSDEAPETYSYSIDIPKGHDISKMRLVAFVSNYDREDPNNCRVYNAEMQALPEPSGVEEMETAGREISEIYSISGVRLDRMQRGVNIVRYTDGTTEKLIVK